MAWAIWHNSVMSGIRHAQTNSLAARLMGRLKLARMLRLSEKDFAGFIAGIENDEAFGELSQPGQTGEKVICFRKFPRGMWARQVQFNEQIFAAKPSVGVQDFLKDREELLPLLRRIGAENFQKDFLYREGTLGLEETARVHGLTPEEARRVMDFVNEFSLKQEVESFGAGDVHAEALKELPNDTPAAQIYVRDGKITISYLSLASARGRYEIDYARLKALEKKLPPGRKRHIRSLIGKMEIANMRKQVLHNVLLQLIDCQHKYFVTENEADIKPLSQRELARTLAVNSGVVNRVIADKCVRLPSGRSILISSLFLSKKDWMKSALKGMLSASEFSALSDVKVAAKLREKTGLRVSRRSVNDYRRELESEDIR